MTALEQLARKLIAVSAGLGRLAAPWLDLGIRVSLAQAFLVVQVTALMLGGDAGSSLSSTWWSDAAQRVVASGFGTAVQAACPLLLVAGLLTRPAALAMLAQVLLLPPPGMTQDRFSLWLALLVWLVVSGPGAFSLDRALARGVVASALPGVRAAAAAFAWCRVRLRPIFLLLLRLALAASIAPLAAGIPGPLRPPGMVAMLPSPWLAGLALLLALGAGTRLVAVLLMAPLPLALAAADQRLFWLLALALLLLHGSGAASLDAVLARALAPRRPDGGADGPHADGPHVVVVGGGFGGVAAARGLAGAACRVTVVDRANHQLFQPLLYQVATASLSPAEIATPIRLLLRDQANARVKLAEVTGVDPGSRSVQLGNQHLGYDYLVLATGARHAYFGRDDWAAFAPGLKSIEDATSIRRRLLLAFERAESTDDLAERAAWLTFAVVGGGPTGVELAGAICELARHGMQGEFRAIDPAQARVLLVQAAPRLLPGFAPKLSAAAAASLRALGVEVMLDRKVDEVLADAVVIDGQTVPARTILWAAGVMASPAAQWLGVAADRAGRVSVRPDLSVDGHPDIFAVGDTALSNAWRGGPVPGLAPAAEQGGAYVARVIAARLAGRPPPPAFRYRHLGSLATIGRDAAVAEFGRVRFTGALAWWIWGAVHIAVLAGGRSRAAVVLNWLWAYLTFRRSTRLIVGAHE